MKIVLVDHHTIIRQGLRSLLEEHGLEVVAEAADGRAGVAMAKEFRPDIVLMETVLPRLNGADATERILAEGGKTRVIALTGRADRQHVTRMIDAGASGYVLTEDSFEHLVQAIDAVAAGGTYHSASLAPIVESHAAGESEEQADGHGALGSREREVLQLLVEGASTRNVAVALDLSTKTVETYRTRIMKKLGVSGMAGLTRYAVRVGVTGLQTAPSDQPVDGVPPLTD